MKRTIVAALLLCVSFAVRAQRPEFFRPYASTQLRLPAVPIIVNDPYFSIWSPYDRLTDGVTRHWTNDPKPILGLLRVDGQEYRFMGEREAVLQAVAPMADEERWEGRVAYQQPSDDWAQPDFDDSRWAVERAAWGSPDLAHISHRWDALESDIFIRREVNLSAEQLAEDLWLKYSHDDVFQLYVNGTLVANTGETWVNNELLQLDARLKALLRPGRNIIAAHCHNTTGGAYADYGLFTNVAPKAQTLLAEQKSVDVLACNTYYTFKAGPVELDLVFSAPMLIDDYDLLSTPVNYISHQVRSTDGRPHDVAIEFQTSPLQAVNSSEQPTVVEEGSADGVHYLRTGTVEQPILAKKGDGICIDWGYLYLPATNGEVSVLATPNRPTLSYIHRYGRVKEGRSFLMMGYDEVQDIEYMFHRYKAYWAHDGQVTITQAFRQMAERYTAIMQRLRQWDKTIYDDGLKAGGREYAEMLSGNYRLVMAAHKLFRDKDGQLLWFSKENNSNGSVNTVDLTYPESPLFLAYNPELQKAMMTSILVYSRSGRWTKPFAAHDIGTYPIADGQTYGADMPVEEAGNMLTLCAMLCKLDGNTLYVDPYWEILTTWVNYLAENGQDPDNQLCTDDFAGHWAHNCNLSLKAICGVAGYAEMARMKGDVATADHYLGVARSMARQWEEQALDGDHYRLAFDRPGTWSQKYNIVWDKLWNLGLFSPKVYERELRYYLGQQHTYGLPLDCRRTYTKSDWIMWTAALSPTQSMFRQFMLPVYRYIHETPSRVPLSDWHETDDGRSVAFKARSVIGGYWMRVFADKWAKQ
ncbi:MAG: DUF4965 domain-containing protein [Bacteroidaceae bacterium]|nr:DUF4965 domain-containing protein [Bacteroidaceae bacterium]